MSFLVDVRLMRVFLAVAVCLAFGSGASADEKRPDPPAALTWSRAFSANSGRNSDRSLVLIYITDDAPFDRARRRAGGSDLEPVETEGPRIWCRDEAERTIRRLLADRPQLASRIELQSLAAGMPTCLTGGKPAGQPSRVITLVCDPTYRLLAFSVGVPNPEELITLIEDGEDVLTTVQFKEGSRAAVVEALAERNEPRLNRQWRQIFAETKLAFLAPMAGEAKNPDSEEQHVGLMRLLYQRYQPVYAADVGVRFGLTDNQDGVRLLSLEQHCQVRRPWCDSILPFLADRDLRQLWKPLCESVWGFRPIAGNEADADLLAWWDANTASPIVLSVKPPAVVDQTEWPPTPIGDANKQILGWDDVQELVVKCRYRTVNSQQLALLIRERQLAEIHLSQPSMTRYLFFGPRSTKPRVIRETDPPGRFVGLLKRAGV